MSQLISASVVDTDGHFMMIPLPQGKFALVDERDAALILSIGRWGLTSPTPNGVRYAIRRQGPSQKGGTSWTQVLMHNLIMGRKGIDHRNLNGLDNRRINLRDATVKQNRANTLPTAKNPTGFKGVFKYGRSSWHAAIGVDGRRRYLGSFSNPVDAARAYNEAALDAFGEYARLNVIPEDAAGAGSGHPGRRPSQTKLTAEIILECRVRAAAGEKGRALAAEFGVAESCMSRALRGETWRHVPFPDAAQPPAA